MIISPLTFTQSPLLRFPHSRVFLADPCMHHDTQYRVVLSRAFMFRPFFFFGSMVLGVTMYDAVLLGNLYSSNESEYEMLYVHQFQ